MDRPSPALLAEMRAWAARGDEFVLSVRVGKLAVPFFKDQIDDCKDDEQLAEYVAGRLAAHGQNTNTDII